MDADAVADVLEVVRARRPLVHSITNPVVMNLTANALLAVGAAPTMAWAVEEVAEVTAQARALVINLGTPTATTLAAMRVAAARARADGIAWVLDPVGAGLSGFRRGAVIELLESRPAVIRGNATEVRVLADEAPGAMRGVDATDSPAAALAGATALAARLGAAIAVTGPTDHVTDGARHVALGSGDPLMARVTGMGCTASALVGAALAVEPDRFVAAAAALSWIGVAGALAAHRSDGPGTFQPLLLDALHRLDREALRAHARIAA
ncbi:MAG: hydroxyethylthiazole kinase [Alphaproteobacteria bacterium]|nr:hydroxyethylthiazole kinase [Alphaproteobacteria bacterium]